MSVLLKYTIGLVLALLLATPANAYTCGEIRSAVLAYGPAAALSWALQHGYTERQIRRVRQVCRV